MRFATGCAVIVFSCLTVCRLIAADKPLTNDDIITLAKAGIGDDVIIAKILHAPKKALDTSTEALVKLKEAGVSQRVLKAILDPKAEEPTAAGPAAGVASTSQTTNADFDARARSEEPRDDNTMLLESKDVTKRIKMMQGKFGSTGFAGIGSNYIVYQGARASARTTDRQPTLTFVHDASPEQYIFLMKLDSNHDDNDRTVKIGSFLKGKGGFSSKNNAKPDPDWTLPYDSREDPPGVWHINPKAALANGEYGLYFQGGLWAFGVDGDASIH